MGTQGENINLTGRNQIIEEGQPIPSYTSAYKLSQIDDLREYVLKQGKKEMVIDDKSDAELKSCLLYTSCSNRISKILKKISRVCKRNV